tara:strand:- start:1255 stop:2733 length:1479 start_codon:yes stop_codon:yes gene_type:complete
MATKTYGTSTQSNLPEVTDTNGYVVSSFTPDDWGGNTNPQEGRALYVVTKATLYARVSDTDAPSSNRNLNFIMGSSPGSTSKEDVRAYNTSNGSANLTTLFNFFAATTSIVLGSTSLYWAGGQAKSTSGFKTTRLTSVSGESVYANSNLFSNSQQYLSFDYYGLPNAPSSISASSTGQNSASISFSSVSASGVAGAPTGYKVQYKESSSSTWLDFTTTTSTSVSVSGLSAGTSYNFRVAGEISTISNVVSGATGTWSSTATATTESSTPPVVTPAPTWSGSYNSGQVNSGYSQDFARASGHDTAYGNISIISGSLPPGLSPFASGEYFYVNGTPSSAGTYSFTLRAQNSGGITDSAFSIFISSSPSPSWVDQVIQTSAIVGESYIDSVSANYADGYSYSGILPPGLNFNSGVISGTPNTPGSYTFTVYATNTSGSAQKSFTITVTSALLNGGKRMTGSSSSASLTTYKRYNGSGWTDLTVAKRFNGSTWEDI